MDVNILGKLIGWFGPAGGFAVFLLGLALWALYKTVIKCFELQEKMVELEKACEKEKAGIIKAHQQALASFKADCEKRLAEAIQTFLDRDNQKRTDVISAFDKLGAFKEAIQDIMKELSDALHKLEVAIVSRK